MELLPPRLLDAPYFTTRMAREAGCEQRDIAAAIRSGDLVRFRRGCYSPAPTWRAADDVGRHLIRARAVVDSLGPDRVVLSHVSAAALHGLPIWGSSLGRVHVTRRGAGAGRVEGDVVHHRASVPDEDLREVDGLPVTVPDRAILEAASRARPEVALTLFDALLHAGLCDHERLLARFHEFERWPRMRHLHIPIRMADGGSESIGESRGRWFCWANGLPVPSTQFAVYDGDRLVATCDWGWPKHGALGEFDGQIKYGRLVEPGREPGDVVFAEKRREDLIRELTSMTLIRLTWSDFDSPRTTAQRIARQLRLAT